MNTKTVEREVADQREAINAAQPSWAMTTEDDEAQERMDEQRNMLGRN